MSDITITQPIITVSMARIEGVKSNFKAPKRIPLFVTQALNFGGSSAGAELTVNKVTVFSSPTNVQYPSAKLVSDALATKETAGAAAAAQAAAIAAAATDATTKANTAISTAATDATTKANNAIATAATDATTKANAAISTASADATTKANNAISTAATDATTKSNAAISTAATDATTKANAAVVTSNAYADGLVGGLLDDRGNYNASSNLFPSSGGSGSAGAIVKGDLWTISVAGVLGGSAVTVGDVVRCLTNAPGQTAANWVITENNFGFVAENSANKATSFASPDNTKYPTTLAVKTEISNEIIAPSRITQGGATTNQVLAWSGSAWVPASISGSPGGSSGQFQYNNASSFAGVPGVAYASNTTTYLSQAAAAIPLAIQAATGQTGNLTEWRNSVGTLFAYIDAVATITAGGPSTSGAIAIIASNAQKLFSNGYYLTQTDGLYLPCRGWDSPFGTRLPSDGSYSFSSTTSNNGAVDTSLVRAAPKVWAATDGVASNGGWLQQGAGDKRVTASVTESVAALANISDLTCTLIAGRKYAFTLYLFVNQSVGADGLQFDFNGGTATATDFVAHAKITKNSLLTAAQVTALNAVVSAAFANGDYFVEVYGHLVCNAAGTFIPRFAKNTHSTGVATLRANSLLMMTDIRN